MRTIHTSQTVSRTWHQLIKDSSTLRQRLYLPCPRDVDDAQTWKDKSPFPPAQPTPWIPHIILNQRSWGSAWPFETHYTTALYEGSGPGKPKHWTFSLELSHYQYDSMPKTGAWRQLLVCSPPFTDFWYTRSFYELGSGRAPFVTHLDYDSKRTKTAQKYRVNRPQGVRLGDLVDAYCEMFEKHSNAKFVMIESLGSMSMTDTRLEEDRPRTKLYMPGLSAEQSLTWH